VAEAKIGAGARVLRDELYPIKVDSVKRTAVLAHGCRRSCQNFMVLIQYCGPLDAVDLNRVELVPKHWRCRAVTVSPRDTNRIRIACRDEAEHQLVKKVALDAVDLNRVELVPKHPGSRTDLCFRHFLH
jgi:hypothetical protein